MKDRHDMMMPICGRLGEATARAKEAPDTSAIADPQWQWAYMRGFERAQRAMKREAMRNKSTTANQKGRANVTD